MCFHAIVIKLHELNPLIICECYSLNFSCSPTSTAYIYTTKLVLLQQIYYEAIAKNELKIESNNLVFIVGGKYLHDCEIIKSNIKKTIQSFYFYFKKITLIIVMSFYVNPGQVYWGGPSLLRFGIKTTPCKWFFELLRAKTTYQHLMSSIIIFGMMIAITYVFYGKHNHWFSSINVLGNTIYDCVREAK